jgi:PGF-CTERM protein
MSRWATPLRLGVAAALVVVLAANGPALAHTNDVEVDSQVSADGRLVVERGYSLVDGYFVVHRTNATGGIGEAVGHVRALKSNGVRYGFSIPVDGDAWADWGTNRTVWVALHREETGEGFDPADDPVQSGFGGQVADRAELARGDRAVVATEEFEAQRLTTDAVSVRTVRVDRPARLEIAVGESGADGRVIGSRALAAGTHEDVTVAIDDAVFARRGRALTLTVRLYAGGANDSATTQLRAGGDTVDTSFDVERVGSLTVSNVTTTAGDGGTATAATTGEPDDATGTVTPAPTTEPLFVTPTATATSGDPTETPARTPAPTAAAPSVTAMDTATTSGDGPGFGVAVTLAALVAVAAWARLWSRSQ